MIKVIITADDFGFTDNTNKGIIETVEQGVTTELSLMVNCYGSENAMQYARDNKWNNIGIHLQLFDIAKDEKPFRGKDYDRALTEWSAEKLLDRLKAEIAKFEDFFGTTPSHINGHKQLHFNPKVIDYVFDYASKNNMYFRKWYDFETSTTIDNNLDFVRNKFKEYRIKTSDYLLGFEYDFENPENATSNYKDLIDNTPDEAIIEILFHPCYYDEFEASFKFFERKGNR